MNQPAKASSRLDAVKAGWTGDEESARTLLSSSDSAIRASALGALNRMKKLSADDLCRALHGGGTQLAVRALALAASHSDLVSVDLDDAVIAALSSPDPTVVESAAFCVGERFEPSDDDTDQAERSAQHQDAVSQLASLGRSHTDPLVRESAIAALGAIGDPSGLDAVLAACSDKPQIRRRAAIALVAFDSDEADAALSTMLEDRDWQVRMIAEDLTADDSAREADAPEGGPIENGPDADS